MSKQSNFTKEDEFNVKSIVKIKKIKVVGFFIEPTDRVAQIIRALENLTGVKGVIFAKDGYIRSEGDKSMKYKYSEAVTLKTLTKRDIRAEDVQTLYLVKV